MADWRDRGYVPDSDDDDERAESVGSNLDLAAKVDDGQHDFEDTENQDTAHTVEVPSQLEEDPNVLDKASFTENTPPAKSGHLEASFKHNQGHRSDWIGCEDALLSRLITSHEASLEILASSNSEKASGGSAEILSQDSSFSKDAQLKSYQFLGPSPHNQNGPSNVEDDIGLWDSSSPLSSILSDLPSSLFSQDDHFILPQGLAGSQKVAGTRLSSEERPLAANPDFGKVFAGTELDSGNQRFAEGETTHGFIDLLGHALRQRKPIQLHPYVLESERYRQSLKDRGLKPLKLAQAEHEARRQIESHNESQEFQNTLEDEDEENHTQEAICLSPDPSPPRHLLDHDDEELPELQDLFQKGPQVPNGKLSRPFKAPGINLGRLKDSSHLQNMAALESRSSEAVGKLHRSAPPYATPDQSSSVASGQISASVKLRNVDSAMMNNSNNHRDSNINISESSEEEFNLPRKRVKLARPTLHSPSASESESNASNSSQMHQVQKKMKGVLPASWLRLDQQTRPQSLTRSRLVLGRLSPTRATNQPGIARRIGRGQSSRHSGAAHINFSDRSEDSDSSASGIPPLSHEQSRLSLMQVQDERLVPDVESGSDNMMEQDIIDPMIATNARKHNLDKPKKKRRIQTALKHMTSGPRPPMSATSISKRKNSDGRHQIAHGKHRAPKLHTQAVESQGS